MENVTETTNADVRKVSAVITVKWAMDRNFIQKAIAKNNAVTVALACQITNANAIRAGRDAFATNVVIKNFTEFMLKSEMFAILSTPQEIVTIATMGAFSLFHQIYTNTHTHREVNKSERHLFGTNEGTN